MFKLATVFNRIKTDPSTRVVFRDIAWNDTTKEYAHPGERLIDYTEGHIYIKKLDGTGFICKTLELETIIDEKIGLVDVDENGNLTFTGNIIWHEGNLTPDDYLLRSGGTMTGTIIFDSGENESYKVMSFNTDVAKGYDVDYIPNLDEIMIYSKTDNTRKFSLASDGRFSSNILNTTDGTIYVKTNKMQIAEDKIIDIFVEDETNPTGKMRYSEYSDKLGFGNTQLRPTGDNILNVGIALEQTQMFIGHTTLEGFSNPTEYIFGNGTDKFSKLTMGDLYVRNNIAIGSSGSITLPNSVRIMGGLLDNSANVSMLYMNVEDKVTLGSMSNDVLINTNRILLPVEEPTQIIKNDTIFNLESGSNEIMSLTSGSKVLSMGKDGIMNVLSGINIGGILLKKNTEENTLDIIFA